MIKNIKNILVLVCVCSVITVLLAVTNSITAPIIDQNEKASANEALLKVMPDGTGFEPMELGGYTLPATVTEAYKETAGKGYVLKLTTSGYAANMVIMCGVTADGKVSGAVCLSSNETMGKEKTYGENFKDKDADGVNAVDTISSATKTTQGYKNAVKDALNAAVILGGGSVDVRTEEEILADNLAAALPAGDGKFEKVFITEEIDGVNTLYVAENQTGYVCVVGEQFVGVNANGAVITDGVENAEAIEKAVAAIKGSTLQDIDLTKFSDLTYLLSAKKTTGGNYVVETRGAGYGINGDSTYKPISNEYIVVRVAISKNGKILDCLTVSQAETEGVGDACANESFYGQFDGKTKENYTEIDAISRATITTNGYKQAIGRAFDAVAALKKGGK